MKKILFSQIILLSFLLSIAGIVKAQTTIQQDSFIVAIEPSSSTHGSDTLLWVQDSLNACNDTRVTYLQVDVTGLNVNTAQLTLTAGPIVSAGSDSAMITLYGVDDIAGGVTGVNTGNDIDPPIASDGGTTVIQSVAGPNAVNDTIVFGAAHPTTSNLGNYIAAQAAGDGIATFALSFSSGCGAGSTTATFQSLEDAGGQGPSLTMWNPTSINLNSAGASASTTNNPLTWLAIALPLFAAITILVLRRRQSTV